MAQPSPRRDRLYQKKGAKDQRHCADAEQLAVEQLLFNPTYVMGGKIAKWESWMSGGGDASGAAVGGGLVGRGGSSKTSKSEANKLVDGHFAEADCLNCGYGLTGPHCHNCGQKAHLHRTIGAFLHDLLHGALHFDGKTWRTLPMLALKPGALTRRYIEGERVRFISPMALFLFSIFLMFAVFQVIGLTPPTEISTQASVNASIDEVQDSLAAERDALREQIVEAPAASSERVAARRKLGEIEERLAAVVEKKSTQAEGEGVAEVSLGRTGWWGWFDQALDKWRANPGLMLYKLQANSYKFSWLLIPLSVPFVWMLFAWKRRFKAYDHAIFVTYSLAFMSLLFSILSLLGRTGVPTGLVLLVGVAIPPLHIYKQLRGTYGLSNFSALWRTSVLLIFITIVVTLFLQILLLLGTF